MFWKKKEELEEPSEEFNLREESSLNEESNFEKPRMSQALSKLSNLENPQQTNTLEKDIQLILAKLDTIQHLLDNLNQRVKNIEKIAEGE